MGEAGRRKEKGTPSDITGWEQDWNVMCGDLLYLRNTSVVMLGYRMVILSSFIISSALIRNDTRYGAWGKQGGYVVLYRMIIFAGLESRPSPKALPTPFS